MSTEAWRKCQNRTILTCWTNRLFIRLYWLFMQIVCQDVYSPCLMAWEENSHICLRNVVSVLTGDLSSTYVRVLQYFRESIGKNCRYCCCKDMSIH